MLKYLLVVLGTSTLTLYGAAAELKALSQHEIIGTNLGIKATFWRFKVDDAWSVPAVVLTRDQPRGTVILVADGGRQSVAAEVEQLLAAGQRVLAVDPFYFGESKIRSHDSLFALLVAAVGDRLLGIQASQLGAVARWATAQFDESTPRLLAIGPRSSLIGLVAAGLEESAIGEVELRGAMSSLKEAIEQNWGVNQRPELFCFGLLETFDIKQLVALVAPRQVIFVPASERAGAELAGLNGWYATLGKNFHPLHSRTVTR
jgi:hypothetical protein